MAKYGIAKYGVDKYGNISGSNIYYTSTVVASAVNYNQINISWTTITPDPADTAPTYWKLVKSYSGGVDNPDDGIQIEGDVFGSFRTTTIDLLTDEVAQEIVYSIWVYNPTEGWIFCGSDSEVSVIDDGSFNKISKWIPRTWLNENGGVGDATGEPESGNRLSQILSAYTFQYDSLRAKIDVLSKTADVGSVHSSLLPYLVTDAGFQYEPSLGDSYHSTLYSLGDAVVRNKGTAIGISTYINALTHLDANIDVGHNLFLDYNNASFEESLANWTASSGTFVRKAYTGADYPVPYSFDSQFPLRNKGYASLTTTATTAVILTMPGSSYDVTQYGIPVVAGTRYVFSGWAKRIGTVSATLTAKIYWHNSIGGLISSTTAGPSLTIGTSWAEFVSVSDSGRNGKVAPTNAAFAKVELTVTPSSTTSVEYLFDMFQFAEASNSLVYEDARLVTAYLKGDRTNLLLNPSFEAGTSFWSAYNGALTHNSVGISSVLKHGSYVGELTTTAGTEAAIVGDWIAAEPGRAITLAGYVKGTSARKVKARLEFSHRPTSATTISAVITNITGDGTTVTVTANNTFTAGETVTISGVTPSNYSISGTINPGVTATSFSISSNQTGTYVSGGTANMNLLPSNTLYTSGSKQYYSNVVYYVDSDPVTMDGTMKLVQVTATVPAYEKDVGYPLVKASFVVTNNTAADVYTFDALSLQYSDTAKEFFSGSGGILPTNPLTTKYFASSDCIWEKGERKNLVSNPSFETTTGWTTSGITLTSEVPVGYTALFGTNSGKCVYSSTGYLQTTVTLASTAVGGEDVTVSAYVRGAFTNYTIATNPGGTLPTSSTVSVTSANKNQWIRLHTTRKLAAGETSFTFRISVTNPGGSTDTTFFIDGAQAELGLIATKFTNPASSTVTTIANPANSAVNLYATQEPSTDGGSSVYINSYPVKFSRLYNTLSLVMPQGSTWRVVPGLIRDQYPELVESLIPSASFEKDMGTWTLSNSTMTRVISRGLIFGDYVTHGQAYARVATTRVSGSPSFFYGIQSANIPIKAGAGYYLAVAIRADNNTDALHPYRLTVTFYNADGTVHNYDNGGVSTQAAFNTTATLTSGDNAKWVYLAVVVPGARTDKNQFEATGASYAIVKVDAEPTTFNAAQAFHVDRVIFRE